MMTRRIRLVLFDALHTLVTPRLPIHVQYSQVFEPHLGKLEPVRIQSAFKTALKDLQCERPVYVGGVEGWWEEVIRRTAIGAGGNPRVVESSLGTIVPMLMNRFSGTEGYKAFDDVLPALERLRTAGVKTGLVSNADLRMKKVVIGLGLSKYLNPMLISEEEGIEKPTKEMWERACKRAGADLSETLHVGDELECDYIGATRAGLHALLLCRKGREGNGKGERSDDLEGVDTVQNLSEMVMRVSQENGSSRGDG